jgi:hypothetical protein
MKKIIISLIVVLVTTTAFAQIQTIPIITSTPTPTPMSIVSPDTGVVFRLFSTQNTWTFIELNTRNGQLWQIQYSTGNKQMAIPLSMVTRVAKEDERNGRFFLYPTQNIHNFILLDQVDGRVWQVQWSTEDEKRLVIPIE